MIRALVLGCALVLMAAAPAAAGQFDMQAEVKAAIKSLDDAQGQLGGMGGIGTIAEPDLGTIQGLLNDAERLVRQARRYAQDAKTPQDEARAVAYARAGAAMVEAVNEFRVNQGY